MRFFLAIDDKISTNLENLKGIVLPQARGFDRPIFFMVCTPYIYELELNILLKMFNISIILF